jgi:hypothetical protein
MFIMSSQRAERGSINQTQIIFLALSKQCERAFESAANGARGCGYQQIVPHGHLMAY